MQVHKGASLPTSEDVGAFQTHEAIAIHTSTSRTGCRARASSQSSRCFKPSSPRSTSLDASASLIGCSSLGHLVVLFGRKFSRMFPGRFATTFLKGYTLSTDVCSLRAARVSQYGFYGAPSTDCDERYASRWMRRQRGDEIRRVSASSIHGCTKHRVGTLLVRTGDAGARLTGGVTHEVERCRLLLKNREGRYSTP